MNNLRDIDFPNPPEWYDREKFEELGRRLITVGTMMTPVTREVQFAIEFDLMRSQLIAFCGNRGNVERITKLVLERPNQRENMEGALERIKLGWSPYHVMSWVKGNFDG